MDHSFYFVSSDYGVADEEEEDDDEEEEEESLDQTKADFKVIKIKKTKKSTKKTIGKYIVYFSKG